MAIFNSYVKLPEGKPSKTHRRTATSLRTAVAGATEDGGGGRDLAEI